MAGEFMQAMIKASSPDDVMAAAKNNEHKTLGDLLGIVKNKWTVNQASETPQGDTAAPAEQDSSVFGTNKIYTPGQRALRRTMNTA